jgi:hypothetical protein
MFLAQISETEIVNLEHLVKATITEQGTTLNFVDGTTALVEDIYAASLSKWTVGASLRLTEDE